MKKLNNKGFTLVEVVVSCSILSMACLLFLLMSSGTANILSESVDLRNNGTAASEVLELFSINSDKITETAEGNLGYTIPSSGSEPASINIQGEYQTVTVESVSFTLFVPKEIK